MNRLIGLIVALAALALIGFAADEFRSTDDPVVRVASTDKQMNAAIARARETLPVFWQIKSNPTAGQSNLSLKVEITEGEEAEHFWLVDIAEQGDGYTGTIANTPQLVGNVKEGQRYAFPQKDITDWMYMQNNKIHGGYTIRVLVDKMPEGKGARMKALLAYEPD